MVTYIHKNGGGGRGREGHGQNVWQFVTMDICPSISLASDVPNLQLCLHLATQRNSKCFLLFLYNVYFATLSFTRLHVFMILVSLKVPFVCKICQNVVL